MSGRPPLTIHRRLGPGPALRQGTAGPYRAVVPLDGEGHVVRTDLTGGAAPEPGSLEGRGIHCLVHVTDLHLADVESPVRFEFFNHEFGDPRFAALVPTQRPHESLNAHAADAMIRAVNSLPAGPVTGRPPELVVTSGDAIDNAQWNELRAFLAVLEGGPVRIKSGGSAYEGVQAEGWPDRIFWVPDGGPVPDLFREAFGFPRLPGLVERALRPFQAGGLGLPWLACHGNHESLVQGVGVATPELAAGMAGSRKPVALPAGHDRDTAYQDFVERVHVFLAGPSVTVTADADRRPVGRREFVAAHLAAGGHPRGHGFGDRNRRDGTTYHAHDAGPVRIVTLDTACPAGSAEGCVDHDQLAWLERTLAEAHSEFLGPTGETVRGTGPDRLVVVVSHHGSDSLVSTRPHRGPGGEPHGGTAELMAVLQRFPNVILWLDGHTHRNLVTPHRHPSAPGRGLWEVTTCAVVDWPSQARVVEIADAGEGMLAIALTMLDHEGAPDPGTVLAGASLAGLHRQLAGNVPWAGFDSGREGFHHDRNAILLLRDPRIRR